MNYELTNEMREAGFIFRNFDDIDHILSEPIIRFPNRPKDSRLPTLSELIDACGGKFGALLVGPGLDLWTARGNGVEIHAPTKEEAVARLWLSLNKKPA